MGQLRHRLPVLAVLARAGVMPGLLLVGAGLHHMVMLGPVVHLVVVLAGHRRTRTPVSRPADAQ